MKKHIFFTTHTLSIQGKPYQELYFPADCDIAYAWQMAQKEGTKFTRDEKDWFKALKKHELTEKRIMEEEGLPLRDQSTYDPKEGFKKDKLKNAHDKANVTDECPKTFPGYKDKFLRNSKII